MVALITYLYGGEDYSDMYQLCRSEEPLLELPNTHPKKETRYYISSLDFNGLSTREIAYYIKTYWK